MDISLRSYMTAGISLTAAAAIAISPLALPANQNTITIPSISTSDVQLVVTTEEIEEFIANIQASLNDITESVAEVVAIPGQTLADLLADAATMNFDLYTELIAATDNETLIGLLTALQFYSTSGLNNLAVEAEAANDIFVGSLALTTNLLTSALTGSLQNVLIAVNNLVNDPLTFANYAGILAAGIGSGGLLVSNGLESVQTLGNGLFGLGAVGLDTLAFQIDNAVTGFSTILGGIGAATGIGAVEAAISAIQAIVIAPALGFFNVGVGVVGDVVSGVATGFNTLVEGAQGVNFFASNYIQSAIAAIGVDPLDPASYASALGALNIGTLGVFTTVVGTGGALAEIPLGVFRDLNGTFTTVITDLSLEIGIAISNIFEAVGLPADVVQAPLDAAADFNNVVVSVSNNINEGLDFASEAIVDTTTAINGVADDIATGIDDALGNPVIVAPPFPVQFIPPPLVEAPEMALVEGGAADSEVVTTLVATDESSGSTDENGAGADDTTVVGDEEEGDDTGTGGDDEGTVGEDDGDENGTGGDDEGDGAGDDEGTAGDEDGTVGDEDGDDSGTGGDEDADDNGTGADADAGDDNGTDGGTDKGGDAGGSDNDSGDNGNDASKAAA